MSRRSEYKASHDPGRPHRLGWPGLLTVSRALGQPATLCFDAPADEAASRPPALTSRTPVSQVTTWPCVRLLFRFKIWWRCSSRYLRLVVCALREFFDGSLQRE